MKIIHMSSIDEQKSFILKSIDQGAVFIYPTDTIYGIGCDATNVNAVNKVRALKHRPKKPISVVAPDKAWILEHCGHKVKPFLDKLPGPYTLIAPLIHKKAVAPNVVFDLKELGVRIPNHEIIPLLQSSMVPITTTSVNVTGKPHMTSLEDVDPYIVQHVDFIIYDGPIPSSPSILINITQNKEVAR